MFRHAYLPIVLVLMLLLAACSSGESSEPAEPAGSQVADAGGVETATAEPTATIAPTPTATDTPAPTPTLAPTPTEVIEETQSEEDQGSAEGGVAAAGSGWGAAGTDAQTACDHPYLPLRPGATWTYEGSEGPLVWEVMDVQGDSDAATAVLNITVGDVSLDYHWDCSAGEGVASFDFGSLGSAPAGLELTIEHVSSDGQFLLPAEQLVPGATWTTNLESTISFTQEAEGVTIEATGDMITEQQNSVLNADPVEFQGQNVPGIHLEQINNTTMQLTMMGNAIEQAFTLTNSYTLGYGIGFISQTSVTDFGTETLKLVSYSIP